MSFVAFFSMVTGVIFLFNPAGPGSSLSPELLDDTPFKTFLIPGFLLSVVVGFTNLYAVYGAIRNSKHAYQWSIIAGATIVVLITMQIILIDGVHRLDFILFGCGIFTVLIAYQRKGRWAV